MSHQPSGTAGRNPPRGAPAAPEDALAWLDAHTTAPRGEESVGLGQAHGRVLARAVEALEARPASAVAAANGYAVSARATDGAGAYNPLRLRLRRAGPLAADEAMAVASGDPMPHGADAVLAGDDAEVAGGVLEVYAAAAAGEHVTGAGAEARSGTVMMAAGHRLRPHDLAMLAELAVTAPPVARRPRVRLLAAHGGPLERGDTAGPMLEALVRRDGGVVESRRSAADPAALAAGLTEPGADLVLACGGSGDGANDHAVATLARVGTLDIHGVAIRPGETVALGAAGGIPVILLPGVPLAALCAYEVLGGRAVRRLSGMNGDWPYVLRRATLGGKVASTLGRLEVCRVRLEGGMAVPVAVSEARLLASAVRADGFVLVPVNSEGYAEGSEVSVHVYH